jgi:hypothetical protein
MDARREAFEQRIECGALGPRRPAHQLEVAPVQLSRIPRVHSQAPLPPPFAKISPRRGGVHDDRGKFRRLERGAGFAGLPHKSPASVTDP